VSNLAHLTAL